MNTVAQFYIGVDLHKTLVQVCVVDDGGSVVGERRFSVRTLGESHDLFTYLRPYRTDGRIAVEAIGVNRWFVNALRDGGYEVVVCDPTKLNLKMLGRKTDRRDAQDIARRLYLGDIDRKATTWYADDETYGRRKVLRARHAQIEQRQQVINQIRALLNAYKITGFASDLTSKRMIARLSALELVTEDLTAVLQSWVSIMTHLGDSISLLDRQLREMIRGSQAEALQRQLRYVGPVTASVLVNELGDVRRFKNSRAVAAYAGLVPRVNQSADTAHHGRLTKRGNRELRHVLGEWAVRLMSCDPTVIAWAKPRLRRSHKNKVRMALARRLLIGVYRTLLTGEAFAMDRCLGLT
jgi:transposase